MFDFENADMVFSSLSSPQMVVQAKMRRNMQSSIIHSVHSKTSLNSLREEEKLFLKTLETILNPQQKNDFAKFVEAVADGVIIVNSHSFHDLIKLRVLDCFFYFMDDSPSMGLPEENEKQSLVAQLIKALGLNSNDEVFTNWFEYASRYIAMAADDTVRDKLVESIAYLFVPLSMYETGWSINNECRPVQEAQKRLVFEVVDLLMQTSLQNGYNYLFSWICQASGMQFTDGDLEKITRYTLQEPIKEKISFFYHLCARNQLKDQQILSLCRALLQDIDKVISHSPTKMSRQALSSSGNILSPSYYGMLMARQPTLDHEDLYRILRMLSSLADRPNCMEHWTRFQAIMEKWLIKHSVYKAEAICSFTETKCFAIPDAEVWIKDLENVGKVYECYIAHASHDFLRNPLSQEALYFFLCKFNEAVWQLSSEQMSRLVLLCLKFIPRQKPSVSICNLVQRIFFQIVLRSYINQEDEIVVSANVLTTLFPDRRQWAANPDMELRRIISELTCVNSCKPHTPMTPLLYSLIVDTFLCFYDLKDDGVTIALSVATSLLDNAEECFMQVLEDFHERKCFDFNKPELISCLINYYEILISGNEIRDQDTLKRLDWMVQTFTIPQERAYRILVQVCRRILTDQGAISLDCPSIFIEMPVLAPYITKKISPIKIAVEFAMECSNVNLFYRWIQGFDENKMLNGNKKEMVLIVQSYKRLIENAQFLRKDTLESFVWMNKNFSISPNWNSAILLSTILTQLLNEDKISKKDLACLLRLLKKSVMPATTDNLLKLLQIAIKAKKMNFFFELLQVFHKKNWSCLDVHDNKGAVIEAYQSLLEQTKYIQKVTLKCFLWIIERWRLALQDKQILLMAIIKQLNSVNVLKDDQCVDYKDFIAVLKVLDPLSDDGLNVNKVNFIKEEADDVLKLLICPFKFFERLELDSENLEQNLEGFLDPVNSIVKALSATHENQSCDQAKDNECVGKDDDYAIEEVVDVAALHWAYAWMETYENIRNFCVKRLQDLYTPTKVVQNDQPREFEKKTRIIVLGNPYLLPYKKLLADILVKIREVLDNFKDKQKFQLLLKNRAEEVGDDILTAMCKSANASDIDQYG